MHLLVKTFALGFMFCLSGCGGPAVRYSPLNNPSTAIGEAIAEAVEARGPIRPDEVRIFVTQEPDSPYRELGVLSYSTNSYIPNEETSFRLFKEKAAEIGADGVIILPSREQGNYPPGLYGYRWLSSPNSTLTTFRGMAIQFIEKSPSIKLP